MPPEFSSPAHQHLLINHVPIIGLAFAVLSLVIALAAGGRPAQRIALFLVFLASGSVVAVNWTGHNAYKEVRKVADDAGTDWLDEHMSRAESAAPVFYVLAVLAAGAALIPLRWPRAGLPLGWVVLLLALACLRVSAWVAQAGGQVRHAEIRTGPPPLTGQ